MSLFETLVRKVTHPLWMRRDGRGSFNAIDRSYRDYDSLSREQIDARQDRHVTALLEHAFDTTTYYRQIAERLGMDRATFGRPESLTALPVLTKEIIRDRTDDLLSSHFARQALLPVSTGGSTGVPLSFYRDLECVVRRKAQELFFDRWMGFEIGKKTALFVAAKHAPTGMSGFKARLRNATSDRMLAFDPACTSDAEMEQFLPRFLEFEPDLIRCFPNSLIVFADFLERKGVEVTPPLAVSCTGETLYQHQKDLFTRVFRAPIFEKYGTIDAGVIACECPQHDGMHVFMDGNLVELLDAEDRPVPEGQPGNVVVTDLFNYGMPFVRYKIGDVAAWTEAPCPCGSPLPRLTRLFGRDRDILVAAGGVPRPGYLFVQVVHKHDLPGQFQIVQESVDRVVVRVVKHAGYDSNPHTGHEALVRREFQDLLGEGVEIEFVYVEEIPREPSGKYRFVQSKVSPFRRKVAP